jgi:hypothetical protein
MFFMKTLQIPDAIFRCAKSKAVEQGAPVRQFVMEAVEDKLKAISTRLAKPRMKHVGKLKALRKETQLRATNPRNGRRLALRFSL